MDVDTYLLDNKHYYCDICRYITERKLNFERHLNTISHSKQKVNIENNIITTQLISINDLENHISHINYDKKFHCVFCSFSTNHKGNFTKHLSTKTHKCNVIQQEYKPFICEKCRKVYKYASGLSKHKQKCDIVVKYNTDIDNIVKNLETKLNEQNIKINKTLCELATRPTNKVVYSHTNNKTINIETYLNIECKDAINMSDFINQIKLSFKDAVFMGKQGFAKAFQTHVIDEIQRMDKTKRPLHCINKRQELLYIKDKNVWSKDKEHDLIKYYMSCFRDKELREIYNKSSQLSNGYYETDKEVTERIDALSEVSKSYKPNVKDKIVKQVVKQLYLSKNDIC